MYTIKVTQEFGRGIYASRDIRKGEVVQNCELLILSQDDTKKVNETDLKYYTFVYNDKQDCLALGDGEIFNHADKPNVVYLLHTVNNGINNNGQLVSPVMMFKASRDIKQGEQLFIYYSADSKDTKPKEYVNKNLL